MKLLKILCPLFLCLNISYLSASNDFVEAGKYFQLDARLLWAIAYKESRHSPHIISKPNKNGSYDIGIMQINSSHLTWLKRDYGISEKDLRDNPRINIYVGALILRRCFDKHRAPLYLPKRTHINVNATQAHSKQQMLTNKGAPQPIVNERALSLARQNGQGILSALQSVAPHHRAALTNAISCYNGRIANNPYGNEVLQILDNAERQNNKRLAKARAKNYFKAEKQRLFVKAMQ